MNESQWQRAPSLGSIARMSTKRILRKGLLHVSHQTVKQLLKHWTVRSRRGKSKKRSSRRHGRLGDGGDPTWSLRKVFPVLMLGVLCLLTTVQFSILRGLYRPAAIHPQRLVNNFGHRNWSGELRPQMPWTTVDYGAIAVLIDQPDFCEWRRPEVKIVCYVHTAPENSARRRWIRLTWGSNGFYDRFRMVTVFFVGRTPAAALQQSIVDESAEHRDIVQMDFDDAYYNLTYKAVTALAWIRRRCAGVEIVLKTDDDVFVDVFKFIEAAVAEVRHAAEDYVYCHVHSKMEPQRIPTSKWYVTPIEYPGDLYPDFCAGMAMYFRFGVVSRLLSVTHLVPYLKLDDVYVTGMLREMAGVEIRDVSMTIDLFDGQLCAVPFTPKVFCHVFNTNQKWDLWVNLVLAETVNLYRSKQRFNISPLHDILLKARRLVVLN